MCIAFPGTVINLNKRLATVRFSESSSEALVGECIVKVGDSVLVQMGIIVKILTPDERKHLDTAWKEINLLDQH